MVKKYIITFIFFTLLLHPAPKVFNSFGNELEIFIKECKTLQNTTFIPSNIKKKCKAFIFTSKKVFKYGYKLDKIDGDIAEKKLNKYISSLRSLDNDKENIIDAVYLELIKSRKEDNIKYFQKLIKLRIISLHEGDYKFMSKHEDVFNTYYQYRNYLAIQKAHKEHKIRQEKFQEKKRIQKKKEIHDAQEIKKNNNSLLKYVDLVSGIPLLSNGVLSVTIIYKNRQIDKQVQWKQDTATISCIVYSDGGKWPNHKKEFPLGRIKQNVTHSFQNIYINVKKTTRTYGILECHLDTGYRKFHFENDFLIR